MEAGRGDLKKSWMIGRQGVKVGRQGVRIGRQVIRVGRQEAVKDGWGQGWKGVCLVYFYV